MQILLAALISCQYGSDFKWKEKLDNKLESEILDFETSRQITSFWTSQKHKRAEYILPLLKSKKNQPWSETAGNQFHKPV